MVLVINSVSGVSVSATQPPHHCDRTEQTNQTLVLSVHIRGGWDDWWTVDVFLWLDTSRRPSKSWAKNTKSTSLCTTHTEGRTTSGVSQVSMKRPASKNSLLEWPTEALASASLARWAKRRKATSRTAGLHQTATPMLWQRPSPAPACLKKKKEANRRREPAVWQLML